MANRSEAYDLSLFEPRWDNTAPAYEPRREPGKSRRSNVVELPQRQQRPNGRPKRHPLRFAVTALSFLLLMSLCAGMVYSQQQLALLTEEINAATQTLEESRSLEVQLSMRAAQTMNSAEVEEYAAKELGMTKVSSGQVSYVNVSRQDCGTVVEAMESGSVLDGLWMKLKALLV